MRRARVLRQFIAIIFGIISGGLAAFVSSLGFPDATSYFAQIVSGVGSVAFALFAIAQLGWAPQRILPVLTVMLAGLAIVTTAAVVAVPDWTRAYGILPVNSWWLVLVGSWTATLVTAAWGYPCQRKQSEAVGTTLRCVGISLILFLVITLTGAQLSQLKEPRFSPMGGRVKMPLPLRLSSDNRFAVIKYTTDGSDPRFAAGRYYVAPFKVTHPAPIRAVAYRWGTRSSDVATTTFLDTDAVARQCDDNARRIGFPASWDGMAADYEMDPEIVAASSEISQALRVLPSICLSAERQAWFGPDGIYSNPLGRGSDWERPCSVEMIGRDGKVLFQKDCGVRIHGNASRSRDDTKKHGFRLCFRKKYGSSKLKYPLFQEGAAETFDYLVLRPGGTDAWSQAEGPYRLHALYIRDEWLRRAHGAMGHTAAHGMFVHVYLNGLYWGVYNLMERVDESFCAAYFGGDKEDWDVVKDGELFAGSAASWNDLIRRVRHIDRASDPVGCDAYRELTAIQADRRALMDVDDYIDYLLVQMYAANTDWPSLNYVIGYRRNGQSGGFKFLCWDGDFSLASAEANGNRMGAEYDPMQFMDMGAALPFKHLQGVEDFRLRFADRVQRHFLEEDGMFYMHPANGCSRAVELFQELAQKVELPLLAESARWGDQFRPTPFRVDIEWITERDRLLADFFPHRTEFLLGLLRRHGLARDAALAHFTRYDLSPGEIEVELSSVDADIYYTCDGTDPRCCGGEVSSSGVRYTAPVRLSPGTTLLARSLQGKRWSALKEIRTPKS
jgi:hypothetical protein